jgi:hypothetical protein
MKPSLSFMLIHACISAKRRAIPMMGMLRLWRKRAQALNLAFCVLKNAKACQT